VSLFEGESGERWREFVGHLVELRRRLLYAALAVFAAFVALLPFSNLLFGVLAAPMTAALPRGGGLIATRVTSTFIVPLKVSFLVALFLTAPFVLYQLWAFVAPGLYRHERRHVGSFLVAAVALFYAGAAFCYFVILPLAFHFFDRVAPSGVRVMTDIASYLTFTLHLMLACGFVFETPVVISLLVALGLVRHETLRRQRRYAFLICFVIAAFVAPPDALSMILLGTPMYLLYELGILLSRPRRAPDPRSPQ
jgi:sec-independent protein translocase protein TatC